MTALKKRNQAPTLNPALRDFWVSPASNRILYGGRNSSKSWDAAGYSIARGQAVETRYLCTRQFQNRIEDSLYQVLKVQIERFKLGPLFDIRKTYIRCRTTGSEWVFFGLWKQVDELRSIEGIDVHLGEECQMMTEYQWEVIEPTIRKDGSENWLLFNPGLITDFVWKRFVVNPPPDTIGRWINYTENPFISEKSLKIIKAMEIEDPEKHAHIYLGEPLSDDTESVIRRSHVLAAIDAHLKLGITITGTRRKGFDVADQGVDKCATIDAFGPLAVGGDLWKAKEDELFKSCQRVWRDATHTSISEIYYDSIGVGAGCGSNFNQIAAQSSVPERMVPRHVKFNAGAGVGKPEAYAVEDAKIRNKDYFSNAKAQAWWSVAQRLSNTYNAVTKGHHYAVEDMIFIDSNMFSRSEGRVGMINLIDDLCTPKRDTDNLGRVKVESKKDLEKRDIDSPNVADAFIMAFLPSELCKSILF